MYSGDMDPGRKRAPTIVMKLVPTALWLLITVLHLIIVFGCVPTATGNSSALGDVYAAKFNSSQNLDLLVAFHAICLVSQTGTKCTATSFQSIPRIADNLGISASDIQSAITFQGRILLPFIDVAGLLLQMSFVSLLLNAFFCRQNRDPGRTVGQIVRNLKLSNRTRRVAFLLGSLSFAFSVIAAIVLAITYGLLQWSSSVAGTGSHMLALTWAAAVLVLLYLLAMMYVSQAENHSSSTAMAPRKSFASESFVDDDA